MKITLPTLEMLERQADADRVCVTPEELRKVVGGVMEAHRLYVAAHEAVLVGDRCGVIRNITNGDKLRNRWGRWHGGTDWVARLADYREEILELWTKRK